jgi:hypothetical protein
MKKVLLLAVVALFVMMPLASFAMTTISDSDLNAITAQEGVSIYLSNVTLSGMNMTMSWGQSSYSSLLANSVTGQLSIDSSGNIQKQGIYGFGFDKGGFIGANVSLGTVSVNGLLTIDVGVNNGVIGGSAYGYPNTFGTSTSGAAGLPGGVQLGLHNMAVSIGSGVAGLADGVQMIIKVGAEETLSGNTTVTLSTGTTGGTSSFTVPSYMTMGTAYIGGLNTTVNGNIFISTH